jgi:hypothetical protein
MADKPKNMKSSSHKREVTAYLRPAIYSKLEKYIETHGGSKSEAINDAICKLVEPMPPQDKIIPK